MSSEVTIINNPLANMDLSSQDGFEMKEDLSYNDTSTIRSYDVQSPEYDRKVKTSKSSPMLKVIVAVLVVYALLSSLAVGIAFWEIFKLKAETSSLTAHLNASQQASSPQSLLEIAQQQSALSEQAI